MMNLHASLLAVVLATQALAQNEIKMYAWTLPASRPGTPTAQFNAGADITVTVGASVNMVQFVADTGTSTDTATYSIGHITIRRSSSAADELRVLIADASSFAAQPDTPLAEGCLHWAGIHGEDSDTSDADEDSVTGRALIVAAAINGNFQQVGSATGWIHAGHIYRLQSQSTIADTGNLNIPVWGFNAGSDIPGGVKTVDHIVIKNSITARILADGAGSAHRNIGRIEVGPATTAAGISGRILCPQGRIFQILSTGPIDIATTGTEPGIQAKTGIELIAATDDPSSPDDPPAGEQYIAARIECS